MSERDTGGPAFPSLDIYEGYNRDRNEYEVKSETTCGMTMRDWFAGQALIGLAASMNSAMRRKYTDGVADGREARLAYRIADAMLNARDTSPVGATGPT